MSLFDNIKRIVQGEEYEDDVIDTAETNRVEEESTRPRRSEATGPVDTTTIRTSVSPYSRPATPEQSQVNRIIDLPAVTQLSVVLVKPESFKDAADIADHLKDKRTVVLNLEDTNRDTARRLLYFLSGVAYARSGKIKRVANSTYIITPLNVEIHGELKQRPVSAKGNPTL